MALIDKLKIKIRDLLITSNGLNNAARKLASEQRIFDNILKGHINIDLDVEQQFVPIYSTVFYQNFVNFYVDKCNKSTINTLSIPVSIGKELRTANTPTKVLEYMLNDVYSDTEFVKLVLKDTTFYYLQGILLDENFDPLIVFGANLSNITIFENYEVKISPKIMLNNKHPLYRVVNKYLLPLAIESKTFINMESNQGHKYEGRLTTRKNFSVDETKSANGLLKISFEEYNYEKQMVPILTEETLLEESDANIRQILLNNEENILLRLSI